MAGPTSPAWASAWSWSGRATRGRAARASRSLLDVGQRRRSRRRAGPLHPTRTRRDTAVRPPSAAGTRRSTPRSQQRLRIQDLERLGPPSGSDRRPVPPAARHRGVRPSGRDAPAHDHLHSPVAEGQGGGDRTVQGVAERRVQLTSRWFSTRSMLGDLLGRVCVGRQPATVQEATRADGHDGEPLRQALAVVRRPLQVALRDSTTGPVPQRWYVVGSRPTPPSACHRN